MSGEASAQPAESSGVVTPQPLRWRGRLAATSIILATRILNITWRMRFEDSAGLFERPNVQPVIFSLWHNRLALSLPVYHRYFLARQPQRKLAALISASRDGAILARTLEHFGIEPVHGSSSRRGAQALRELSTWAEKGYDLAITPDGPRGPRYRVQKGIVALAQITGFPVVPISAHIHWKKCFKSWDAFQFPLPFTRCDVRIGEPVTVPREVGEADREGYRAELESRMNFITVD